MTPEIFKVQILGSTLIVALFVFGVAPGLMLRLILLLYPRDNPRRRELLGELYGVPRFEQPFWVAQQFEVALFEGLGGRVKRWFTSKVSENFQVSENFLCPYCGVMLTAKNNSVVVLVNGAKKINGGRQVVCPHCFPRHLLSILPITIAVIKQGRPCATESDAINLSGCPVEVAGKWRAE